MSDNIFKEFGFVLSLADHREKDRTARIFLKPGNILAALAYGAKNSRRRFGGNIEPFNLVFFDLQRKGDFTWIREARIHKMFLNVRRDRFSLELLLNTSRILTCRPISATNRLFRAYYLLISRLDTAGSDAEKLKYYLFFIAYFLIQEGVFPDRTRCQGCGGREELDFSPDVIAFLCPQCRRAPAARPGGTPAALARFFDMSRDPMRKLTAETFTIGELKLVESVVVRLLSGYLQSAVPPLPRLSVCT